MQKLIGQEYRNFDRIRKWELLYEDMYLVIIEDNIKSGNDINLLGIDSDDLEVKWAIGGLLDSDSQYDGIVNVYIKDKFVHAGTYSGFELKLNYKTGEIIEKVFRK